MKWIRAVWLFVRIVWRVDDAPTGHRMSVGTAWEVAYIVWLKVH